MNGCDPNELHDDAPSDVVFTLAPSDADLTIHLRDGFACAALTGMLTHRFPYGAAPSFLAIEAYKIADAMMAARGGT